MAELHKNQIAWAASAPTHVQLAKRQDYIAEEASQLVDAMSRFAGISADIEDKTAAINLDQTAREAAAELSKEEPSDNNYDRALEKYNSKINGALNSLSPDVRKRFLRDNPDFLARQELNANEIIFEKQQKFTQVKIKTASPKVESRVVAGEISYEQGKKIMQDLVKDTNNAFAEEVLFDFDHSITKAKLTNMLIAGRYSDVIEYASTVEKKNEKGESGIVLDTLTPAERIEFIKTAKQLADAEAEEREKLLNSVSSGTGVDVENALLETGYATLDLSGSETAEFLNALDNPNATIKTKDKVELYMGNIPASIRVSVRSKVQNAAADRKNWRENASVATKQVNEIVESYKQSIVDDTKDSQEHYTQLVNLRNSHQYEYLPNETKDILDEIVDGQDLRLYNHLSTNKTTNLYSGLFSFKDLINDPLQGAATGAVLAGTHGAVLGGPLGIGVGAAAGGAVGLLDAVIPSEKYLGLTGLKALEQTMYPQTLTDISPVNRAGNRATENLQDPQRVYRQATSYARDNFYVGDREVKYGTSAEFVLNMGTKLIALNSFGKDGRSYLGVKNVSDTDVTRTINYMHGILQNSGEYGLILQEIKNDKDAETYTRSLFDSFMTVMTKGAGVDDTESAKLAREEFYKELVQATKGHGGKIFSFTKTEMSVDDEEKLYPYADEKSFKEQMKKDLKKIKG